MSIRSAAPPPRLTFVEYVVRCRRGRGAWTVAHRFREWAQLHRALARDGLKQPLPPKTCSAPQDEPFLEGRSEAPRRTSPRCGSFTTAASATYRARGGPRAFLLLDDQPPQRRLVKGARETKRARCQEPQIPAPRTRPTAP